MGTKNYLKKNEKETESSLLILTSLVFIAGGIAGIISLYVLPLSAAESLSSCIQEFLSDAKANTVTAPELLSTSWSVLRWPLIALLLCSIPICGAIGLLLLIFCKGFILCGFISAFCWAAGGGGLLAAWLLTGISNLILVPILFIVAIHGMERILSHRTGLKGKSGGVFGQASLMSARNWLKCAALLGVCILLNAVIAPALLPII